MLRMATIAAVLVGCAAADPAGAVNLRERADDSPSVRALRQALSSGVTAFIDEIDSYNNPVTYETVTPDLNGDGQPEVIARIRHEELCLDNGQCRMYIAVKRDDRWRLALSRESVDIQVKQRETNGWPRLGLGERTFVWRQGRFVPANASNNQPIPQERAPERTDDRETRAYPSEFDDPTAGNGQVTRNENPNRRTENGRSGDRRQTENEGSKRQSEDNSGLESLWY